MKVFCRVHQVNNIKRSSVQVHIIVLPKGEEVTCECSGVPLSCYKIFRLDINDQWDTEGSIKIMLEEKPFFSKIPTVISFLELPLKLFEQDKTIRSKYQMKAPGLKDCNIDIDVEVHISTNADTRPFNAPSGELLTIPQWNYKTESHVDTYITSPYNESSSREDPLLTQYCPTVYDTYQQNENSFEDNPYADSTITYESTTNPYESI